MTKEQFHIRLRRMRVERKLTMKEVAKGIRVPGTTYREWEYGRAIQGQPYLALSKVLGVTLMELMSGQKGDAAIIMADFERLQSAMGEFKTKLQSLF